MRQERRHISGSSIVADFINQPGGLEFNSDGGEASSIPAVPLVCMRLAVVVLPGNLLLICMISEFTKAVIELTRLNLNASCIAYLLSRHPDETQTD
jgi:hypothetical protein